MKNEKELEKYYIDDPYIRGEYRGQMCFIDLKEV